MDRNTCEKHRHDIIKIIDEKIIKERELRHDVDERFTSRIMSNENSIEGKINKFTFRWIIGGLSSAFFILIMLVYNHSSNVEAQLIAYKDGTFTQMSIISQQLARIEEQTKNLTENFKRLENNSK